MRPGAGTDMEACEVVLSRWHRALAIPHLSSKFTAGHDERLALVVGAMIGRGANSALKRSACRVRRGPGQLLPGTA